MQFDNGFVFSLNRNDCNSGLWIVGIPPRRILSIEEQQFESIRRRNVTMVSIKRSLFATAYEMEVETTTLLCSLPPTKKNLKAFPCRRWMHRTIVTEVQLKMCFLQNSFHYVMTIFFDWKLLPNFLIRFRNHPIDLGAFPSRAQRYQLRHRTTFRQRGSPRYLAGPVGNRQHFGGFFHENFAGRWWTSRFLGNGIKVKIWLISHCFFCAAFSIDVHLFCSPNSFNFQ
jgi:hypothetical protein